MSDSRNHLSLPQPASPDPSLADAVTVPRDAGMTRRLADTGARWLSAIGRLIAAHDNLCVAVLLTFVFYYPSIRNGAQDAGYL